MGDREDQFIPLLTTNILPMAVLSYFEFLEENLVWNRFYVVEKRLVFSVAVSEMCLCLQQLQVRFLFIQMFQSIM